MLDLSSIKLPPLSEQDAKEFLEFARNHSKLKVTRRETILESLPEGHKDLLVSVYDVKVGGFGPDDRIYACTDNKKIPHNSRIRDQITRGCIVVQVTDTSTQETLYWNIFQGLCKFSGMTDEDDDDLALLNESKGNNRKVVKKEVKKEVKVEARINVREENGEVDEILMTTETTETSDSESEDSQTSPNPIDAKPDPFFLESYTAATTLVNTRKENGKACHFAVFDVMHKGENLRFYLAGSKNVHFVYRTEDDIQDNILHSRAGLAMLSMLKEMGEENRKVFEDTLSRTGFIANFEFLLPEDQHIVDYQISKDEPRFLTFTGRRVANDEYVNRFGKCVSPMAAMAWAKKLSVPVSEVCEELPMNSANLEKLIHRVREEDQSEGSVIYFVKGEKVIGLWKLKSQWYIILRAIREKLVRFPPNFNQLIKKRMKGIQDWIKLTNDEVYKWRFLAAKIFEYHIDRIKTGDIAKDSLRSNFAVNLRMFFESFQMPDEDLHELIQDLPNTYDIPVGAKKEDDGQPKNKKNKNKKNKKRKYKNRK